MNSLTAVADWTFHELTGFQLVRKADERGGGGNGGGRGKLGILFMVMEK